MANNLHISYDLIPPGQSYDRVIKSIKELGNWAKVGYSSWYVNSNYTAVQARDYVKKSMDSGDKLFIVDASNNSAAWHGISKEVSDFVLEYWDK